MSKGNGVRHAAMSDGPLHEEVRDLLHAYAHERLMGRSPEASYPTVATHLAVCAVCQDDLDELLEAARAAADTAGDLVLASARANLAHLRRPWLRERPRRPWSVDQLGQLSLEFSEGLLRSWQPSPLLGAARGALLYSYDSDAQPAADDQAQGPEPSLAVDISADPDPRTATLTVTLYLPERGTLDQSGIPVALHGGGEDRRATTDPSGSVRFAGLPRESLAGLRLVATVGRSA